MSYLDRLGLKNMRLMQRFESASAHAPLCHLSPAQRKLAAREVADAPGWEAVSCETRSLIEASEQSREMSLLKPVPFLAK